MEGPTGWAQRSNWVRVSANRDRRGGRARDTDPCRQCRLPWYMHPERYDPQEDGMIRCCSEYPVEPVYAVEKCIVP